MGRIFEKEGLGSLLHELELFFFITRKGEGEIKSRFVEQDTPLGYDAAVSIVYV